MRQWNLFEYSLAWFLVTFWIRITFKTNCITKKITKTYQINDRSTVMLSMETMETTPGSKLSIPSLIYTEFQSHLWTESIFDHRCIRPQFNDPDDCQVNEWKKPSFRQKLTWKFCLIPVRTKSQEMIPLIVGLMMERLVIKTKVCTVKN